MYKLNLFERDWSKLDQENSFLNYLFVDRETLIKSDNKNVDQSHIKFNIRCVCPSKKDFQMKMKIYKYTMDNSWTTKISFH